MLPPSRSDKFTTQHPQEIKPICYQCKHYVEQANACMAFPKGVPLKVLTGEWDHTKNLEGDGGYKFERKT